MSLFSFLEGLFGQHIAKKQKIMRSSLDISYDNAGPVGGSAPSPVASQISNPNRLIRYFGGRDRGGRKNKSLKVLLLSFSFFSLWLTMWPTTPLKYFLCLISCHLYKNLSISICLQLPVNQLDSGSPWTSFEEQVCLVLFNYLHFDWFCCCNDKNIIICV